MSRGYDEREEENILCAQLRETATAESITAFSKSHLVVFLAGKLNNIFCSLQSL